MIRSRHDVARFIGSLIAFVGLIVVVPAGLVAVTRAKFGSANPLAAVDPPWQWFGDDPSSAHESQRYRLAVTEWMRRCRCRAVVTMQRGPRRSYPTRALCNEVPAMAYSPATSRSEYHRRCRA